MGKIIVTGPGRSGTTFIVQMLTRLGYDTGFEPGSEFYREEFRAGCEWNVPMDFDSDTPGDIRRAIDNAPRVLKSPQWSFVLKGLIAMGSLEVDHVIIPIRDIDVAATSRIDAGLDWLVDPNLVGDERIRDQASIMALALGRAIEACYMYSIPCTMMMFPLLVEDVDYCYTKMMNLGDIDRGEFEKCFKDLARPNQIKWKMQKVPAG